MIPNPIATSIHNVGISSTKYASRREERELRLTSDDIFVVEDLPVASPSATGFLERVPELDSPRVTSDSQRPQTFIPRMHRPESFARRIISVNYTRVAYHTMNYRRQSTITLEGRMAKKKWKKENPGKKHPQTIALKKLKPREVLTLHGLLYLAVFSVHYAGRKYPQLSHNAWDFERSANLFPGIQMAEGGTEPAAFEWESDPDSDIETGLGGSDPDERIRRCFISHSLHKFCKSLKFFCMILGIFLKRISTSQIYNDHMDFSYHIPDENRIPKMDARRLRRQLNDMDPAVLDDMTKMDVIARVLFIIQASWMIIQVGGNVFL